MSPKDAHIFRGVPSLWDDALSLLFLRKVNSKKSMLLEKGAEGIFFFLLQTQEIYYRICLNFFLVGMLYLTVLFWNQKPSSETNYLPIYAYTQTNMQIIQAS